MKALTAQEAVLIELRKAIVSGDLAPGEQIVQDALAQRFGVSRVPLREALKILEGERQVVYLPHRGYFVAELSMDDLREVYRIRDLLESEAVAVAVPLLDDADIDALADLVEQCNDAGRAGDLVAMAAANRAFHFGIVEGCGMPRLARLIAVLWDATDVYRARYYAEPSNVTAVASEHARVLTAIRARDAADVVVLLREHRERAVERLARVLEHSH